jgi:hypothetical protein
MNRDSLFICVESGDKEAEPSKTCQGLNSVSDLEPPPCPICSIRIATHCQRIANLRNFIMNINLTFGPVVSLIAGILILIMPRLLNYIIALYLIVMGLVGLFGTGNLHL